MNLWKRLKEWFRGLVVESHEPEMILEEGDSTNWSNPKKAKPKKKGKIIKCNVCKEMVHITNKFHCPYCKKYHCDKHRLPENHGCKNPKTPKEIRRGGGIMKYGSGGKVEYSTE